VVSGGLVAYVLLGEMRHLRQEKALLYQQLMDEYKAHMALAATCAQGK
jgi:hypothetical protein